LRNTITKNTAHPSDLKNNC